MRLNLIRLAGAYFGFRWLLLAQYDYLQMNQRKSILYSIRMNTCPLPMHADGGPVALCPHPLTNVLLMGILIVEQLRKY